MTDGDHKRMSTPRQKTIREPRQMTGVGLHTGQPVEMRLLPGAVNSGVVFRRADLPDAPEIVGRIENVVSTNRGTAIGDGEAKVHTVEHLLAALAGAEIDNVVVELSASEPPAGDGSARPFLDLLREAGQEEQDGPVRSITVSETFCIAEAGAQYVVTPSQQLEVSTSIEFDHPNVGRQFASFRITRETFEREIAPARTFGFASEVDALHAQGLALGGSPDNAIVLTESGLLEGTELRFPDEFARHKTLDVLGDLALLGCRLQANIVAQRPSHQGNVALAKEIFARAQKKALARPILEVEQIMQYLPHRYPFLLVDRVIDYEEGKRIIGLKNVTINEPFFVGHFPGRPTMPGVLIIEAMAQVGGLLIMDTIENPEDKIVYFMTLDKVKWRRPVVPGDQIRFDVEVMQIRGRTARMRGVGTVDGQVVAEAEMMARVVDR